LIYFIEKKNYFVYLERVRIVGGWQSILDAEDRMHLIINEEKKIRFDTSHAGPGKIVEF
jgi:hypothetical protein